MVLYLAMAFWAAIGPDLQRPAGLDAGAGHRADRRADGLPVAVDRRPVGQADLGHLVGLGRAADLELILLFLYIGYLSLRGAIEDERRADRASALLAIVGVVNVPIIYFSVKWWNTLHQGASVQP